MTRSQVQEKVRTMARKMTTKKDLLMTLAEAVGEEYKDDSTRAGVVVSWLGKEWYASIVRYPTYGEKLVVHAAKGASLVATLRDLSRKFVGGDAKARLRELVGGGS